MSKCAHCGNENQPESKYYSRCGRSLAPASQNALPANPKHWGFGRKGELAGEPTHSNFAGFTRIVVAAIEASGIIVAALVGGFISEARGKQGTESRLIPTISFVETKLAELSAQPPLMSLPSAPIATSTLESSATVGILQGTVTDQNGAPLNNARVSVVSDLQTTTDSLENFVLEQLSAGRQTIFVEQVTGEGRNTQNIEIVALRPTDVNLAIDSCAHPKICHTI